MTRTLVAIFAHNEERRISRCIDSLPLRSDAFEFHLLVNGSSDRTVEIASKLTSASPHFYIHDIAERGKARTWNHFVDSIFDDASPACLFVDGDAELNSGALEVMAATLAAKPHANGVNAMPVTGRNQAAYRAAMLDEHGLFGALYGLNGAFVSRLKASGIRLPADLIGDDGLIAALAKSDLRPESASDKHRIANCELAQFRFEQTDWRVPTTWALQYRRMINYSIRRYQNLVISQIMRTVGPSALPATMRETYAAHWHLFNVRPTYALFDLLAKRQMERKASS